MAKQPKPDVKQMFAKLAKDAGLDDASAQTILKALDNPQFNQGVASSVMMQDEYNRSKDALRAEQEQTRATIDNWQKWYENDAKPTVAAARARLAQYEATYGPLEDAQSTPDPNVVRTASGDYVSKAEFQKLLQENNMSMAGATGQFVKQVVGVAGRHFKQFNEELDTDALEEFMKERGISDVRAGYKEFISPRMEELREQETARKIAEAKAEGAREARAKTNFPDDPKPQRIPLFDDVRETVNPNAMAAPAVTKPGRMERLASWMDKWEKAGEAEAAKVD